MTVGGTRSAAATGAATADRPDPARGRAPPGSWRRRCGGSSGLGRAEPRADRQRGGASVHRPWPGRTSGAIRSGQPGRARIGTTDASPNGRLSAWLSASTSGMGRAVRRRAWAATSRASASGASTPVAIDLPVKKAEDVVGQVPDDRPGPARRPAARRSPSVASRTAAGSRASPPPRPEPTTPALVLLQLPAPPARQARAGGGADEPLAGDPLPGPAAVGRGGPVRPDRAAARRRAAPPRRRARHVPAPRPHAETGPRRRARPGRRLPPAGEPRDRVRQGAPHRSGMDKATYPGLYPRRRDDTGGWSRGRTEDARRRAQSGLALTLRCTDGSPDPAFPHRSARSPCRLGRKEHHCQTWPAAVARSPSPSRSRRSSSRWFRSWPIPPRRRPGINRFLYALGQVESGGSYTARNPSSGAYGKYQIMPSNWPAWAKLYVGSSTRPVDAAEPGDGGPRQGHRPVELARHVAERRPLVADRLRRHEPGPLVELLARTTSTSS